MESNLLIRCIVVDDEHPAIRLLSGYVKKTPGLQLMLQTTHAPEALEAIKRGGADLIFLDIQMPALTGIQLIEAIKGSKTKVILTTAYAEYALEGYKHDVVDYLLKPVTFERFLMAVAKAKQRMAQSAPGACNGHLLIKTEYRLHKTDYADILYIEGLGDYLIFHTNTGKLITLERMKNMESTLPAECFLRIHKSFIVNVTRIDYLERSKVVIARQHLPVGDTYKDAVKLKLGW
jgi:two-component system LytT family response regulator